MATIDSDIPKPIPNQDCQGLLIDPSAYSSWMRKRSFRNKLKIFAWPQVFVVIMDGCMYYYRSEMSKCPAGSFSLYGYNAVKRAEEIPKKDQPWAFKIVHTFVQYKTYYFTATSEKDMKTWMKRIKSEMKRANRINRPTRTVGDGKEKEEDDMSMTYQDIETKIYDDPHLLIIPQNYHNRTEADISDDEDETDDAYAHRGPQPPPLPKRPSGGKKLEKRMKSSSVPEASKKMENISLNPGKEKKSGLQRGKPEGESVKVKVTPELSVETDEDDQNKYWDSIYFKGQKEEAGEIIRKLADEGVYMVRNSDDGGQVLVVFVENMPKKYKINCEGEEYYLTSKSAERFESVETLCYYYYSNDLPTAPVKLSTPYRLHTKFPTL